jgi:hypothetical protein
VQGTGISNLYKITVKKYTHLKEHLYMLWCCVMTYAKSNVQRNINPRSKNLISKWGPK